jgi:biopolymer transport protein ExbD
MGGGASFGDEDGGSISDINVTPLVDVVLVLLIVFMITMPAVLGNSPVKVNLPENAAYSDGSDNLPVNVFLKSEGSGKLGWFIGGTRLGDEAAFKAKLTSMNLGKEQSVNVTADRDIAYKHVVKVMDVLGQLGITKVSLPTKHTQLK